MNVNRRLFHILLGLISLAGIAALLISTRWGPGIGGDATIYITSAKNFLLGRGLGLIEPDGSFRLIPYFAPFFPLALAGLGALGFNLVEAAHWLNMLLFGGLIWISGQTLFNATRSATVGLLAAALAASSPILIPIYSWAMSEPLSLFLGFAGLSLGLKSLRCPQDRAAYWGSAVLAGLSFLTRYSSAAFLGALALGMLFFRSGTFLRRLWNAVAYGLVGALPTFVWLVYDWSQTATVSSRSMESAAGMARRAAGFWPLLQPVLLNWLLPSSWVSDPPYPEKLNLILLAVVTLALAAWILWLSRQSKTSQSPDGWQDSARLGWLLGLLALVYLGIILLVYVTTYPPITIDSRMLSPLHVAFLWLLAGLAGLSLLRWRLRWLYAALPLALVLVVGWFGWRSLRIVQQNYDLGLGYTSVAWQNSATITALKEIPAGQPIVTNETMAVLFLTGRNAYSLAEIYASQPLEKFTRYGEAPTPGDEGQTVFRDQGAPLVLFDTISTQMEGVYGERTAERLKILTGGLRQGFKGDDGAIYYLK